MVNELLDGHNQSLVDIRLQWLFYFKNWVILLVAELNFRPIFCKPNEKVISRLSYY